MALQSGKKYQALLGTSQKALSSVSSSLQHRAHIWPHIWKILPPCANTETSGPVTQGAEDWRQIFKDGYQQDAGQLGDRARKRSNRSDAKRTKASKVNKLTRDLWAPCGMNSSDAMEGKLILSWERFELPVNNHFAPHIPLNSQSTVYKWAPMKTS